MAMVLGGKRKGGKAAALAITDGDESDDSMPSLQTVSDSSDEDDEYDDDEDDDDYDSNGPDSEDDYDTDEEDEFFDAIESNTLPNLVITQSLIQPSPSQQFLSREVYAAYLKLRDHLAISSDDRPPMSLWAVLKNSIGKDLTKISFPVFFNEPTSMLQRMVRVVSLRF